jgi:hypothetical protein
MDFCPAYTTLISKNFKQTLKDLPESEANHKAHTAYGKSQL